MNSCYEGTVFRVFNSLARPSFDVVDVLTYTRPVGDEIVVQGYLRRTAGAAEPSLIPGEKPRNSQSENERHA